MFSETGPRLQSFLKVKVTVTLLCEIDMVEFTVALQFNSHKSVQKLFHNLHIIYSNSLMGLKVICQLEKEPLKGLANVQEIIS